MSLPPKIVIEGQDMSASFVSEFYCFNNSNEFVLTLLDIIPQMKYANIERKDPATDKITKVARIAPHSVMHKIIGRYGMSPASFKKLVMLLNQNLQKYEKKFGEIVIQQPEYLH